MSSSFKQLALTLLAVGTYFSVVFPKTALATPNWEQEARSESQSETRSFLWGQNCLPQLRVSVDNNNEVIHVQKIGNTDCPISIEINLFIQDNYRQSPLRLSAVRSPYRSDIWIANYGDARQGRYRVMGIDPTPTGMNDNTYNSSRELGIDQVITIGEVRNRHPVPDPPPVGEEQPQQIVTTLDAESKQLLRNFAQWMSWFQVQMDWLKANWPQLEPLIRAIEAIKIS